MKLIESLRIAMLKRVKQFGVDHPLNPPIVKATAHYAEVDTILATLENLGGSQDLSTGTLRGTTGEKSDAAEALRSVMGKLSKIAKILDKTIYPTVAAEMRLTGTNAYQDLLERGRAFVASLADKAAVFIEHGAPATVEADLTGAVAALETAIGHKASALSTRVGSTAGLDAFTRAGLSARRKLDAILSAVYADDVVLLAGWNSAKRVHDDPLNNPADEDGEGAEAPASAPADSSPTV